MWNLSLSLSPTRSVVLLLILLTAILPTREMLVRGFTFLSLATAALSLSVSVSVSTAPASYPGIPASLDLLTAPLSSVLDHLDAGDVTSVALVNAYLQRIAKDNHQGLLLRAVIETAPLETAGNVTGVLAIARELDEERKQGKLRGRLHGVPIIVKVRAAASRLCWDRFPDAHLLYRTTVPLKSAWE